MARRADLKTGTDCNSNCVFCVIGDQLFTGDRSTEDCVAELRASRATCEDVVFTGAEVTIRPDFFHLIETARRLGYRTIQIQTNGRMLAYRQFCERAVTAGANEFSPSIHGHEARLHDGLTRSKGSFDQVVAAIRHLRSLGQRIVTNTVATRQNAPHLAELARLLVELRVDQFQIAFPHPTGHAATHFEAVVPRMAELAPQVRAALDVGRRAGVACVAEAMPFCQLPGYERHVAELIIPPTEIVYDGFVVPDYARDRMERGKTRFAQCAPCRFEPMCEGPWRQYPERVGSAEFQPVLGPRVLDASVVLDDRWGMLGLSAPPLDLPAVGGGEDRLRLDEIRSRWVAVAFYPEDGSPACTDEACALQAGLARLDAAGVAIVGVSPDGLDRHRAFARANGLGFPLLSDENLDTARAWRAALPGQGLRRSTYLLDATRRIAHVLVQPSPRRHAAEILEAIARHEAGPRPIDRDGDGEELVILRRRPA